MTKKTVVMVFTNVLEENLAEIEEALKNSTEWLNQGKMISGYPYGKDKTIKELAESITPLKVLIHELKQQQSSIVEYSDNMSIKDWARYIVHTKPTSFENLVKADPNSNAPIFMEQNKKSQRKNVSVHNAGAELSNTNDSPVPAKAPVTKTSTVGQQSVGPRPNTTTTVPAQVPVTQASTGAQQKLGFLTCKINHLALLLQ